MCDEIKLQSMIDELYNSFLSYIENGANKLHNYPNFSKLYAEIKHEVSKGYCNKGNINATDT